MSKIIPFKFSVGDTVTIRQWDDMEREYGTIRGAIQIPRIFTRRMSVNCGESADISHVYNRNYCIHGMDEQYSPEMFEERRTSYLVDRGLNLMVNLSVREKYNILSRSDLLDLYNVTYNILEPGIFKIERNFDKINLFLKELQKKLNKIGCYNGRRYI